jgi:predicted DNA-binding protein YlxM (UPF0122 family)
MYIDKDMSVSDIAKTCGVSNDVIKYMIKKYQYKKSDKGLNITMDDIKAEADKIANEMLASKGIAHNQPSDQVSSQVSSQVSDQVTSNSMDDKVDAFFASLAKENESSEVPLDYQPTMNVLTRMYEAGEENYEHVFFQPNKTIIVKLQKPRYNPNMELQRIKFNVDNSNFKYTVVSQDDSDFVIEIKLS